MQRRDAAIIFWSIAGLYAITRGVLALTAAFYLGSYFVGLSVMSSTNRISALVLTIASDLPALVLLAGGAIVLRRRFQLAEWTLRAEPSTEEEQPGPDAPVAELEPAPEPVGALDLCALCVAAVGILTIVISFAELGYDAREWMRRSPGRNVLELAFHLLNFGLGWALLLRRQRIASWILGRRMAGSVGDAARLQTAGLALFGLFLVLWYLPQIAVFAVSALQKPNPLHYFFRYTRQYLLQPLFGCAIGLVLILGKVGMQQTWRALRSQSAGESDEDGEDGEDGPASTPTA